MKKMTEQNPYKYGTQQLSSMFTTKTSNVIVNNQINTKLSFRFTQGAKEIKDYPLALCRSHGLHSANCLLSLTGFLTSQSSHKGETP